MSTMKLFVLSVLLVPAMLHAEDALVAVASNFVLTAERLKTDFESQTEHSITIASASTGSLYAQILNGAPYDVLLAADRIRPGLLVKSGHAISGSQFTFASGRLALWSANADRILADLRSTLGQPDINSLAIANPAVAPYGVASRQFLQSLNVWGDLRGKIVMGENVGQTHTFVATGNAELGIGAYSLVLADESVRQEAYLPIPESQHTPIDQDAVLLRHGERNPAATGFLAFIKSDDARQTIASLGYSTH